MLSLLIGAVPLALFAFVFTLVVRVQRARIRARATRTDLPLRREARNLSARLFVETSVVGGPQSGGINRGRADLVLTREALLVATHHGRMLQIDGTHPGTAVCTGPLRLVVEGLHPAGITRVRVELVVDDAEGWAAAVQALPRG